MLTSIAYCLQAPVTVAETLTFEAWADQWFSAARVSQAPIDLAIRMACGADRIAWVFSSAYQSALRALVPDARADEMLSLCVTEETGNRPRDIQTRIDTLPDGRLRVNGCKRWAMVGPVPTSLLVVGVVEPQSSKNAPSLRVVKVPIGSTGLSIPHAQATRFIPEVPHCAVQLNNVEAGPEALMPGDGYLAYMKPFRTFEDVYVSAATLAYLLRQARVRGWPTDYMERLAAALATMHMIATQPPLEALTHVLLAGTLQMVGSLRAEATALWKEASDASAERWRRDSPLFEVADTARRMRRDRAWEQLRAT